MKSTSKLSLSKLKSRSFFCVLNNVNHLFDKTDTFFDNPKFSNKTREKVQTFRDNLDKDNYTPEEVVDYLIQLWVGDLDIRRSCAINYEIGDNGTHHCHMVLEDKAQARASAIMKVFPTIHIELTRGKKKDVTAYVEKIGKFEEKNHTIVVPARYSGDIEGKQGKRSDLADIQDMLEAGLTPEDIMSSNLAYRRYSKMIKEHFFRLRFEQTPIVKKNLKVYWHTGASGSGKSFYQTQLIENYGRQNVYVVTDYSNGGFDLYQAEPILFLDEFKGNLRFSVFLGLLDIYPNQVHARYANTYALWNTVHITSIYLPNTAYYEMVPSEYRSIDDIEQLYRRITQLVYHFKTDDGQYKQLLFDRSYYEIYTQAELEAFCQQYHKQDPSKTIYHFIPLQKAATSDDQEESDDLD